MPDDVGGKPFPGGWEPDDDRGGADKDFASVVFDEDFIRAAVVHEPTAVERLLAAAEARAQADAARARRSRRPTDGEYGSYGRSRAHHDPQDLDYDPDGDDDAEPGSYGPGGYRGAARWHRPVAWLLALVMGVGMVALAFSAVYRGASANRQDPAPPPVTSGVDQPGVIPPAAVEHSRPTVSATAPAP
ncbi:hypothetical protein J7F02_06585 [Streptomyces sp. ISL-112]|uniref:SCO2584 family spore wall biosynthesis protein n=1 Tax=Streptomyces sp. ISL-112 TaxID=2819176 RepID=UPI001BE88206|nr:hypothetical protein [Streptomyces sp. ISL-112]MBT2425358.1 hypothetical protein [Streptomyces sp. ISL-112]